MKENIYTVISGSGSYIPEVVVNNDHFLNFKFYDQATRAPFERENDGRLKIREIWKPG